MKIGLDERIFSLNQIVEILKQQNPETKSKTPENIELVELYNINLADPFFDSLKEDYPEFPE